MVQLTELNGIAIAEICVYTPALSIGVLLSFRHGFGRNAGWLYLILFSLMRILGAALELATIDNPDNVSLLIGSATLTNIGLSPLLLIMLGLVGRVLESIRRSTDTLVQPRMLRLVQLLVILGLILGIVGGVETGNEIGNAQAGGTGFAYTVPTVSQAGMALMIAGFGLLVVTTVLCGLQIGDAEPGEKRLALAVALALPFVLVRLVFSAVSTYDSSNPNFRQYGGGPNYPSYLIGMAVVMEMVAVVIIEAIGLTLRRIPKDERKAVEVAQGVPMGRFARRGMWQQYAQNGATQV